MHAQMYPVALAIAYILLVGYLARTIFVCVKLPGPVGIILIGLALGEFMPPELIEARDALQQLAFFLVLLTAGFEISLQDLSVPFVLLALLPLTFELVGTALTAWCFLGLDRVEAMVMATVLCALGDGLVMPKLFELGRKYSDHPLLKVLFHAAPLEVAFALSLFGVLRGFADVKDVEEAPVYIHILGKSTNIVLTLLLGTAFGAGCAWVLPRRTEVVFAGQQLFAGTSVESLLLVCAVTLAAFSLGLNSHDQEPFVPLGFAPGPAFSSELLVIVIGAVFATCVDHHDLREVEEALGSLWVAGQLVLFSMLGSRDMFAPFSRSSGKVFPLMAAGLTCRAIGTAVTVWITHYLRTCHKGCQECVHANQRALLPDTLFCFMVVLPRATVQCAMSGLPLRDGFFYHSPGGIEAAKLIFDAGSIYVIFLATVGSVLVEAFGTQLLEASQARAKRHEPARMSSAEQWQSGWTAQRRALLRSAMATNAMKREVEPQAEIPDDDSTDEEPELSLPLCQLNHVKPVQKRRTTAMRPSYRRSDVSKSMG